DTTQRGHTALLSKRGRRATVAGGAETAGAAGRARWAMRKQGIVVLVGAVAMLAVGCDWGQIGFGPRHRSFNPGEVAFTTDNVDELQPDWNAVNVEQGGGVL